MADNKIRYNIRPYKNIIPCGGYKMLGGGQIGDSVIPGYVDALLSEKASILDPMLFGVVDEQAEIIEEEGFKVVKNIKMFLATALYGTELVKTGLETTDAVSEKISKKAKVLNCYDIINTWYHMLGLEAFEISNEEQDDMFALHFFVKKIRAQLFVPSAPSGDGDVLISSILCEPDDISAITNSFIYFTEHGNELRLKGRINDKK